MAFVDRLQLPLERPPSLSLRLPKGVGQTEIWWFSFQDRSQPPATQKAQRFSAGAALARSARAPA